MLWNKKNKSLWENGVKMVQQEVMLARRTASHTGLAVSPAGGNFHLCVRLRIRLVHKTGCPRFIVVFLSLKHPVHNAFLIVMATWKVTTVEQLYSCQLWVCDCKWFPNQHSLVDWGYCNHGRMYVYVRDGGNKFPHSTLDVEYTSYPLIVTPQTTRTIVPSRSNLQVLQGNHDNLFSVNYISIRMKTSFERSYRSPPPRS